MKQNIIRSAFWVMLITFLSKFLGFFREILIGIQYGVNYQTDAFFLATSLPQIIFSSILLSISTAFIPMYTDIVTKTNKEKGMEYTNRILNTVIIFSVLVTIICMVYSEDIVKVLAGGFNEDATKITVKFLLISLPMCIFLAISQIFTGFLQSNQQYIASAAINIPANVLLLCVMLLVNGTNIESLVWATVGGTLLQIFVQLPFLKRQRYSYRLTLGWHDNYVRDTWKLVIPVFISTSIQQINLLIDRMLASGLEEGSISALNFATKLNGFVFGIVATSIATIIFPILSKYQSEKDMVEFQKTTVRSLNLITIITLPIVVLTMVLNKPIIQLLFEHGAFNREATMMTAGALFYYAFGMLFLGYREVLNRVFYSFHDTKTPMVNGIIAIVVNIIFSIVLAEFMSFKGIALASSIAAAVTSILLLRSMYYKFKIKLGFKMVITTLKILAASIIAGGSSKLVYENFNIDSIQGDIIIASKLFFSVITGTLIYIVFIYLFKIEEVNVITKSLKRRFTKNQ
ncbi:murein biosynthesis integral membrane protein MurJ [Bacillus cereus]|uniref:murein biosynthesis integral membrane protein MurJ n=1 Tax=Bacillus cereus TaxID=1396 RepID=UPI00027BF323|nr:murein biosynthesis integral membrane protein MurJ [Bacillus cereus]EJV64232.1 integral membrane protein MviN [Bacillus cereus BAG6O-2]